MDSNSLIAVSSANSTLPQHLYPSMIPSTPFIHPSFTPASVTQGIRENGRISPIRRFFCLFVTFDLLLISLLWLIILELSGNFQWILVYHQQILHYSMKSSLFDIVVCSLSRFVILLIFYALFQISHWCIVALTTASTCVLLAVKVYVFDWGDSTTQILQVILILTSFILVWLEVWLMDIKVIPQERVARNYANALAGNERAPLVNPFAQNQVSSDTMSASVNFYSPYENSSDSTDDELNQTAKSIRQIKYDCNNSRRSDDTYKIKAKEILEEAWEMINNNKWIFERKTDEGDIISSQKIDVRLETGHTVYKLIGLVDASYIDVKKVLYDNLESFPEWNPSIQEAKVLQEIDSCTDISYQISKKVGLVASREYITLRHWEEKYGYCIIASGSVIWPRLPTSKKIVRGENGPGCWVFQRKSEWQTEVKWLLNTKINGWVPQAAVETAMIKVMSNTMIHLRRCLSSTSKKCAQLL
ncbi:steroidogenic acute regulatory protein-like [Cimex lectularius]|uniref:Uncharacterized protein n=1 Tax=Cimex lectularius TaxID=79782 RepID=A0A8I6RIS3_CIMLE|nr:steroidogenic acute regulatory protein-like [Cimex lectularius]